MMQHAPTIGDVIKRMEAERDALQLRIKTLERALNDVLAFDSMDYGQHIKGMQNIARKALKS